MEMFLCKCKHNGGRGLFAVYGKAFRLKAQQLTAKNFHFDGNISSTVAAQRRSVTWIINEMMSSHGSIQYST